MSACERNEWTVARTSLVVRLFTQTTLTARVTLAAIPLQSSTPTLPSERVRRRSQHEEANRADDAAERVDPSGDADAFDASLDDAQCDGADGKGEDPERCVPEQRIIREAEVDELLGEQPADHARPVDKQRRGEHELDLVIAARGESVRAGGSTATRSTAARARG